MTVDPILLALSGALFFSAGAAFGGWYVSRPIRSREREVDDAENIPDDNQLAVEDERKMFCLSCGTTHYKQICPFCDSDAQDPL